MRALLASLLFLAGASLVGAAEPSPTPDTSGYAERLVGRWRDENSLIEYRADGTKHAFFDGGLYLAGKWRMEEDVIVFEPDGRAPVTRHRILRFEADRLVLQSLGNKQIYNARRFVTPPSPAE